MIREIHFQIDLVAELEDNEVVKFYKEMDSAMQEFVNFHLGHVTDWDSKIVGNKVVIRKEEE